MPSSKPRRAGRKVGPGGPRRVLHVTTDAALLEAASARAEAVGVPFARFLDVALRAELQRHGVEVLVAEGVDAALEGVVRGKRIG